MAYVDLDKVIEVNWGGWSVYPGGDDPAPYPVLSQSIGIFNKPDARDGDSNGRFGLLNNSNNAVNAQNNNWNTQMALAVDSWIGALSTRIKSFDFSQNIWQVDWGQIRYVSFANITNNISYYDEIKWPMAYVEFNESLNILDNVKEKTYFPTNSTSFLNARTYIVTSGWNRYLVAHINWVIGTFNIDADNCVTSNTPISFTGTPGVSYIVAAKNNYIWTIEMLWEETWNQFSSHTGTLKTTGRLYSINPSWDLSQVWTDVLIYQPTDTTLWTNNDWIHNRDWNIASHIIDNSCHIFLSNRFRSVLFTNPSTITFYSWFSYFTIDMSNVWAFTYSLRRNRTESQTSNYPSYVTPWYVCEFPRNHTPYGHRRLNWYYDTDNNIMKVSAGDINKIWNISNMSVTDTWLTSFSLWDIRHRYIWSMSYLQTETSNVYVKTRDRLNINWVDVQNTLTNLGENILNVYEFTGSNTNDDAYVSTLLNTNVQPSGEDISNEYIWMLKINGVDVPNSWALLFPAQTWNRINALPNLTQSHIKTISLPQQLIWQKHLEVELYTTNARWFPIKLALWATWGTYATPTLPANNGMTSGNATTPWVPWTDASYINLTLSA